MRKHAFLALVVVSLAACGDRVAPARPDMGSDDAGGGDMGDSKTDTGPSKIDIGEPCGGPADCVEQASCIGTVAGQFICMERCETPYSSCTDGSVCTPVSDGSSSICYIGGNLAATAPCTSNLQCGPGLLCFGSSPDFFCRDACEVGTTDSCLPDEFCLELGTGAGICRDVLGAACQSDADCPGTDLRCTTTIDAAWAAVFPGGYCTTTCQGESDCSFGSRCADIDASTTDVCIKTCDHLSDCRFNASYRCVQRQECDAEADPDLCVRLTPAGSACLM